MGDGLGVGSEFGFGNYLRFFNLLPLFVKVVVASNFSSVFGIRSVSVALPRYVRKTPYLSSTYYPGSALSPLLIIGRSKVRVLLGPPFFMKFNKL
jgi:hypothetical protein